MGGTEGPSSHSSSPHLLLMALSGAPCCSPAPSNSQVFAEEHYLQFWYSTLSARLFLAPHHHVMPDEQINKSLKRLYCSLLPTCTDAKINLKNCLSILLCVKLRMHSSGGKVGREKQAEIPSCSPKYPVPPSVHCSALGALLVPPWLSELLEENFCFCLGETGPDYWHRDRSAIWMCRSALPFAQLLPLHLWKVLALVVGRVCVLIFPCSQKDVAIFLQKNKACALISKYLSLDTGDVYQLILKQKKIFQLLIYFF